MNTLEKQILTVLEKSIENHEAAGYSVLVRRGGEEIAMVTAGYADIAARKPIARDSIFRLYSQSKPITSAAVMMLIERGVIDLFDPVETYLPGFANPRVMTDGGLAAANRSVNIMDLLSMTAGLAYPDADKVGQLTAEVFMKDQDEIAKGGGLGTVDFCNELGKLPLTFQPGTQFRYSTCADVLGAVVEAASGKPFAQFLREELFEPLGMKDTAFWVPAEKQDRLVTCYKRVPGGLEAFRSQHLCVGIYDHEPAFASGGAGLVSTLDDYARFAQMLMNGGELDGVRVLCPATVEWMTQAQIPSSMIWESLSGFGYGKLMRICTEPGRAPGLARLGEYGWDGWLGTYFANIPSDDLTILLAHNTTDSGTTACTRKVRNVILGMSSDSASRQGT